MIGNIIDRRTNPHNVHCTAIFEPSWHDNDVNGATKFEVTDTAIQYDELEETTVQSALKYAEQWTFPVTVYLYDLGSQLDENWVDSSELAGC